MVATYSWALQGGLRDTVLLGSLNLPPEPTHLDTSNIWDVLSMAERPRPPPLLQQSTTLPRSWGGDLCQPAVLRPDVPFGVWKRSWEPHHQH